MTHRLWPALLLAAALPLVACPPPEEDDDDDVVAPPDDDDDDCDVDLDCDFTTGLEICGDEGVCIDGDRNNERAEAQLVEYNTSTQLFVAPAGDVDWFRFSGTQGDLILITTEAEDPETLDTVVQYYDEDGNEIAFNDDFDRVSSVPPDSRLYSAVPATGTFYFTVQDRRSWANDPTDPAVGGSDSRYVVTLGRAPGDTFITVADEPNDDPADATLWDVVDVLTNYTAGGILEPTGDADYIRVPVEEGQALRVYGFPNSGSLGTAQVTVLLPDGVTEIATYEGLGWATDQRALVPVLETDDYYLRVREADGRGGFDYWYYLHAAKNDAADGAPAESEPNDLAEDADDITELDALWARIHPAGDVDQYVFEATGDERLTLRAVRTEHGETTALDLALLDPDGNEVASDTWNGGEDDNLVELLELVEGTYTLRVAEQNPDAGDQANRFYALEIITQ